MIHRSPLIRLVVVLMCVAVPLSALANGRARGGGSSIEFTAPDTPHDSVQLLVSLPNGETLSREYQGGRPLTLRLSDLGTDVPDGQYNYEVRATPRVSADVKKRLASARAANDDAAARKIMREAGLEPVTYSGAFTVANGAIVNTEAVEQDAAGESSSMRSEDTTIAGPATPRSGKITVNDQVIPDDLIVQGSACVGFDCVNNESFGFDTIRLKENNTRIKFEDTSTGSFPTNDWQLTANDSASGGANKFSVEDITGAKVPLTITAGAATNSVFVDSTGRVGFRTSTPVLDLHVSTSNTPAIRLEQTNAGGFTAQTWDIAGNEANFFVRDVTGGSRLPFRIRPGAPTSSLDISALGNVGIGTASPGLRLDVRNTAAASATARVTNTDAAGYSGIEFYDSNASTVGLFVGTDNANNISRFSSVADFPFVFLTNNVERFRITPGGDIGINCDAPGADLVIASGSGCTTPSSSINAGSAQFTVASSRTFKENLAPVSVPNILDKIASVDVYTYDFKKGPKNRLGLVAEDFHTVFGRGDEKYIDGNDVQMALWMAVQQLTEQNKALQQRLDQLEQKQQ